MRNAYLAALVCSFLATAQQALADIVPNPPSPPPPDQNLPVVLAGVCLSLAIAFFGLWFVNYKKAAHAKLALAQKMGSGSVTDLNQFSNSR